MTRYQAIQRYGQPEEGHWAEEASWCTLWEVPDEVKADLIGWINSATGLPVSHIYCNKDMVNSLDRAITNVIKRGLASQLHSFDGCLMIRDTRGQPGLISAHSHAGAIDINASTNQLGSEGDISDELAACFTEAGFTWGKTFFRKDPMHFSWLSY